MEHKLENRFRILKIRSEHLTYLFHRTEFTRRIEGLPYDARFFSYHHDFITDRLWILVWSSEFDNIQEGEVFPDLLLYW